MVNKNIFALGFVSFFTYLVSSMLISILAALGAVVTGMIWRHLVSNGR